MATSIADVTVTQGRTAESFHQGTGPELTAEDALAASLDYVPQPAIIGESNIFGVIGPRRRGKSLLAAYLIASMAKAYFQRTGEHLNVFHNGPLKFGRAVTMKELIEKPDWLENAILWLDEVQEFFDPIKTSTLAQYHFAHLLQQIGKRNLWIIWTGQKERMISQRLLDQTDWAIFVDSLVRPWRPLRPSRHEHFDTGRFAERCKPRPDHPQCTKYEKNLLVYGRWVAQENARAPLGSTFYSKLHCAQRFFGLYDTKLMIAPEEFLGLTSENIRQMGTHEIMLKAGELINSLVDRGLEEVGAAQFAAYLSREHGIQIDDSKAGRLLKAWGMSQRRRKKSYLLEMINLAVPADEGAVDRPPPRGGRRGPVRRIPVTRARDPDR